MKRTGLAILAAGFWINLSEFLRNEFALKQHWLDHYEYLRLTFPSAPINGALWGLWGFLFAGCIVVVRRHMSCIGTIALSWTFGFSLMWIVVGNLNVLPISLLPVAAPWSLAEVTIAVIIAQKIIKNRNSNLRIDPYPG
jgi:hypothetical protein